MKIQQKTIRRFEVKDVGGRMFYSIPILEGVRNRGFNNFMRMRKNFSSVFSLLFPIFIASSLLLFNAGCGKEGKKEVLSCTTDADCQTGYICQNGQCVKEQAGSCTTDADCQSGQICQNGQCVAQQDTTPPETTITSYPSDPTNSTSATFEFSSTETGSSFECQLDSGGWTSCSSPKTYSGLTEGNHTFEVRAIDSAGNVDPSPASYTWTIDTTPPNSADTSKITVNQNPPGYADTVSGSAGAVEPGAWVIIYADAGGTQEIGRTQANSDGSFGEISIGDNQYDTVYIVVEDGAGNRSSEVSVNNDVSPPDTSINSYPSSLTNSTSATFTFTSPDTDVVSFECQLDGGGWQTCSSPKTYSGLSEGSHTFEVRAIDSAGNVDPSPASYTWTIDTTPPNSADTSKITVNQNPPGYADTVSGSAGAVEPGAWVIIYADAGGTQEIGRTQANSDGSFGEISIGDNQYDTVYIVVEDGAGNRSSEVSVNNDISPPDTSINSYPSSLTNSTSATFTFTSPDTDVVSFECELDGSGWQACTSPKTYSGLSEGSHTFEVRAIDSAGNVDPSPATYPWTINLGTWHIPSGLTCFLRGRSEHTAVWTGSEMIVWGGHYYGGSYHYLNTGGRYDPTTDRWYPIPTTNVPSGRYAHTAVWTGSEMIVWGGYDGSNFLNTGGIYDPSTNSWVPTSTINAPTGRRYHTAVWTGSEMIIWGGYGSSYLNTGGRYDPSTDSWTATSTTNAPAGRYKHTAVWTGSEMIVWGGYYYDYYDPPYHHYLNTGGRYDPLTDTWYPLPTTNAPTEREEHTAVWTGSKMIVWGGYYYNGTNQYYLNTGGRYDLLTNKWYPLPTTNAPAGRHKHTSVWTGSEMIVWGGFDGSNFLNTGGIWNPYTNSWYPLPTTNAPPERGEHTAVWTGSEMIVWGGYNFSYLNTGGIYYPSSGTWSSTSSPCADLPTERSGHTAIWIGTKLIVWGGYNGSNYLNTGGRYDPSTDSWYPTSTINAPAARGSHTAVWTGSEMIVWGGYDGSNYLNTGGIYDPSIDSWYPTSTTNAPAGRREHTAVWTGSEMIVWGGRGSGGYLDTGGKYNPSTNSWVPTSTTNAPSGREGHTAVWTGSEMIVWGGKFVAGSFSYYLNTGGIYNPSTDSWSPTSTTDAPSRRAYHTAVWTGSEMIVWGGYDGGNLNTGGIYNPFTGTWYPTSTTNVPSGRFDHTAVWTGSEMIVWGGYDGSNYLNTGGIYDPSTNSWVPTSTINAPTGRRYHTAVWTGSEMIVWGGYDGSYLNDGGIYIP